VIRNKSGTALSYPGGRFASVAVFLLVVVIIAALFREDIALQISQRRAARILARHKEAFPYIEIVDNPKCVSLHGHVNTINEFYTLTNLMKSNGVRPVYYGILIGGPSGISWDLYELGRRRE